MSEQNKAVFRKYLDGVNNGNPAIVEQVCADNFVYHGTGPMSNANRDAMKQFLTAITSAFPDGKMTIDDLLADGDKGVYRATFRGTHKGELFGVPASNKQVTVRTIGLVRVANGKIAEEWENFDEMGLMQQLGVIPAHA